jgi:pre-peptidase
MKSRFFGVLALVACGGLSAIPARADTRDVVPVPESEPNNSPATADALVLAGGCQVASGAITPTGDLDYFSFTAAPGARVWAFVDTSASSTGQDDSLLTLIAPDGTTPIEQDDDDGTATNCGTTIVNQVSSTIAGRVLTAGGTYYLLVGGFSPAVTVTSYRLMVVVTSSATAEVEPNNSSATANPIVTSGSPIGVRNSAIGVLGDVDYYSVDAVAGSTLFISADGDPERNGGTDIVVDLISPNGSTVIISVDNSDDVGFPAPPAESFCYAVPISGTYFVRVSGFTSTKITTTGTYSLMVAACGLPATPTPTPTRTATTVVGGPTATPTRTATVTATSGPATATPTRTSTPLGGGGIAPSDIPTLSFPMLLLMALALIASAFVLVRRL